MSRAPYVRAASVALLAITAAVVFQATGVSQGVGGRPFENASLTYSHGQSVEPVFHGWMPNPDGSFDLFFSYINRNWQEEIDIPIGPDNNIAPAEFGPDGGQPAHFFPRINRWQFSVRVPKDFGSREVVWSLTSHGQTHRAYASLSPGYAVDDFLIMHEFGNSIRGRKRPTLQVEGEKQRTAKVGQPARLVAVATDPNAPLKETRGGARFPDNVGGNLIRTAARGLRFAWYVYREPVGAHVKFDPPIPFKIWEDERGGSPYSPGWQPPPVPPNNTWIHDAIFASPGTYVLRGQAHDGFQYANEDITFTVTP